MRHSSSGLSALLAATALSSVACGSSSSSTATDASTSPSTGVDASAQGDGGAAAIAAGEKLVRSFACAACHGAPDGSLSGQTTPQPGTLSYPPNLTPDRDTGLGNWTDTQIRDAILNGVSHDGRQLCPAMLRYGELGMTQSDAENVVAYLRSLAPVSREVPKTTSCTTADGGTDGGL
jgi:hypothetical protein